MPRETTRNYRKALAVLLLVAAAVVFAAMIKPFNLNLDADLGHGAEDRTLFYLDNARRVDFDVEQTFHNFAVSGAMGCGKTRYAEQTIMAAMLGNGNYGALVACPKPDTANQVATWAREFGRERDVIIVKPDGKSTFNVLNDAVKPSSGPDVLKAGADLLKEVSEMQDRGRMTSGGNEAKFFTMSGDRLNYHLINIDLRKNGNISSARTLQMLQTVPETVHAAQSGAGFCAEQCAGALRNCTVEQLTSVRESVDYLLLELAGTDSRTKSNIIATSSVLWSAFRQSPLKELFDGPTVVSPRMVLEGKIVCIDVPATVSEFKTAFTLWKLSTQRLLLSRIGQREKREVVIYMGESANFISSSDHIFLSMARESSTSTVIGFQSLNNLTSEIKSLDQVKALLSNIHTRIYMNNSCPETNEWASLDCGEREFIEYSGGGKPIDNGPFSVLRAGGPIVKDPHVSVSKQRKRVIPAEKFTMLKRANRKTGLAEAYIRYLKPDGLWVWNAFFDVNISRRKHGWWNRFRSSVDVVNLK